MGLLPQEKLAEIFQSGLTGNTIDPPQGGSFFVCETRANHGRTELDGYSFTNHTSGA